MFEANGFRKPRKMSPPVTYVGDVSKIVNSYTASSTGARRKAIGWPTWSLRTAHHSLAAASPAALMIHDDNQVLKAEGVTFATHVVGEYRSTQHTVNNAVYYIKTADARIALWGVPQDGRFWWYIGPIEELGQASGWLRTSAAAGGLGCPVARDDDAQREWQVFSSLSVSSWKRAASVHCIEIGVVDLLLVRGRLPINDAQVHAHMGEFARVPHQISNGRPVYERVGQPDTLMWYAPAGAWVIGQLANVGGNMGTLCCACDARLPELIGAAKWATFDADHRIWITHRTFVSVVVLGSPRVALREGSQCHSAFLRLRNVDFVRSLPEGAETTCLYRATDNLHAMWHSGGAWTLGLLRKDEDGDIIPHEIAFAKDSACSPDMVRAPWNFVANSHTSLGGDCGYLRFEASCSPRVIIGGALLPQRHHDKFGEYERAPGVVVHGRGVYRQVGNPGRMIWFVDGCWYIGRATEVGSCCGWFSAHHDVPTPDQVRTSWRLSSGGNPSIISAPNVRCVRMGFRSIRIQYIKQSAAFTQLGVFTAAPDRLRNDKPFYECLSEENGEQYVAWWSNGYWFIGCGDPRVDSCVTTWVQTCDAACVLEEVTGDWVEWQPTVCKWQPRSLRLMPAENDPSMLPPARIAVKMKAGMPDEPYVHRLGVFILCKQRCNNCPVYVHDLVPQRLMWRLAPYWYIGKAIDRGTARGWLQVQSTARSPELIRGEWQYWEQTQGTWSDAPGIRISVLPPVEEVDKGALKAADSQIGVDVAIGVPDIDCGMARNSAGDSVSGGATAPLSTRALDPVRGVEVKSASRDGATQGTLVRL